MPRAPKVRYSPALAKRICTLLSAGTPLTKICERSGYPDRHTVRHWVVEHAEFRDMYNTARGFWADSLAEEIIEIGDAVKGTENNAEVQAAKLATDNRKWVASRLLPDRWGDRISQEISGPGGRDLLPAEPASSSKIALAIWTILAAGQDKELPVQQTLLASALLDPEPAPVLVEPEPEPVLDPVYDGIYEHGEPVRPVFDKLSGKIVRFAPKGGR